MTRSPNDFRHDAHAHRWLLGLRRQLGCLGVPGAIACISRPGTHERLVGPDEWGPRDSVCVWRSRGCPLPRKGLGLAVADFCGVKAWMPSPYPSTASLHCEMRRETYPSISAISAIGVYPDVEVYLDIGVYLYIGV